MEFFYIQLQFHMLDSVYDVSCQEWWICFIIIGEYLK